MSFDELAMTVICVAVVVEVLVRFCIWLVMYFVLLLLVESLIWVEGSCLN